MPCQHDGHHFIVQLLWFAWAFRGGQPDAWTGRVFYVWLSVFNLFVVSIFWSFMADIFRPDQAQRLFGSIMAGGSLGAICGPLVTAGVVAFKMIANRMPILYEHPKYKGLDH